MSTEAHRKTDRQRSEKLLMLFALVAAGVVVGKCAARPRSAVPRRREAASSFAATTVEPIWVPIGTRESREGAGAPTWRVTLCLVEWDAYWRNPHEFGKFKQVQAASGCAEPSRTRVLDLATAAADARRRATPPLEPSGFVFQESRVGSTLIANMLAAVPTHLVYSEGLRLPTSPRATRAQRVAAVRDYVTLLGAPTRADGRPPGGT